MGRCTEPGTRSRAVEQLALSTSSKLPLGLSRIHRLPEVKMIGKLRAVLVVAGFALIVTLFSSGRRDAVAAATVTRYEEVKNWPSLPPGVQLGETAGVAVDVNGHAVILHRPGP